MKGGYHIRLSVTKPTNHTTPTSASYQRSHLDTSTFVPSSLFEPLPAHPPKPTGRRYTFHHPREAVQPAEPSEEEPERKDYRLGPLRVDWVDFDDMDVNGVSRRGSVKDKGQSRKGECKAMQSNYNARFPHRCVGRFRTSHPAKERKRDGLHATCHPQRLPVLLK